MSPNEPDPIESWEYLLHHLHEGDEPHHCNLIDHLGNLFIIKHAEIPRGGQETETVHVVAGLADEQKILWSDEDAESAGYDVPCPGRQLRASEGGDLYMPEKDRARWVAIWNSSYKQCIDRSGKDCDVEAFRIANGVAMSKKSAEWTTAYVNDLPDSAFLWLAPGGSKDEEGKTKPRSLRYFPYKDADGKVDLPHLRNAIARIPQATHPDLTDELKQRLQEKARAILERETAKGAVEESYQHIISMLEEALQEKITPNPKKGEFLDRPWVQDVFPTTVVYVYDGRLWEAPYSIDNTTGSTKVTIGDPYEVTVSYVKLAAEGDFPTRAFLNKLRELLAEKVKDGVLGQEEFDECVRLARAHAGGMARAEKLKNTQPDGGGGAATELAELAALGQNYRLFVQIDRRRFADAPSWIPVLPKPGTYRHPSYGEIKITRKRNERFVSNFNSGIYQERIPIDAEHETKLSGALGWIVEMRLNDDGSADGRVEWNERGETALAEERFAYVSPEWYDEWNDPVSGKLHKDVLIGVALTTRPFFKEKSLRSLLAGEGNLYVVSYGSSPTGEPRYVRLQLERSGDMTDNPVAPVQGAEDLARRFDELKLALEQEKRAREAAENQARQAAERIAALETDARKKRFEDIVYGRGAGTIRFFGEPEKHVDFLMKLSERFGEDSEEVRFYVAEKQTQARQLAESELFKTRGTSAPAPGSAQARMESLARSKQEAAAGKLSFERAFAEVMQEHPELYGEYLRESRAGSNI